MLDTIAESLGSSTVLEAGTGILEECLRGTALGAGAAGWEVGAGMVGYKVRGRGKEDGGVGTGGGIIVGGLVGEGIVEVEVGGECECECGGVMKGTLCVVSKVETSVSDSMAPQVEGMERSSMLTRVPGSKSTGCESKCSINVTWKESKMCPEAGFQRQYALE
jgi:hypothetical protein